MATEKKTTKGTKPKKPQDRKRKGEDKPKRVEETPGFNLLKPFADVPVWDQTPLLKLIYKLQGDAEEGDQIEIDMDNDEMIELVGDLGRAMVPLAVNEEEYIKFASGPQAAQKVMELAMAWASALGEAKSSAGN